MPTTIIGAVIAGAVAGSTIVGGALVLGFSWLAAAGSLIMGGLSRAFAKKPGTPSGQGSVFSAQGRTLTVRQPVSPWKVIIGEDRQGGVLTFGELSSDKSVFHMVVTLACHECDAIGEVQLDDEIITPDMLDADGDVISGRFSREVSTPYTENYAVPGSPFQVTTLNDVTSVQSVSYVSGNSESSFDVILPEGTDYTRSGKVFTFAEAHMGRTVTINYTKETTEGRLRIVKSLGNEAYGTQPFPDLVTQSAGKWTASHRQDGHAKVWLRFETAVLEGSTPQVSAVIRGLKLNDPRTGTARWLPNPALAVATYFADDEWGLDADVDDEVDEDTLIASANSCEERVAHAAGQTTTFTATDANDTLELAEESRTPLTGAGVRVASSGSLPGGLAADTTYYAIRMSPRKIRLATTYANALALIPIDITSAGSGTLTLTYYDEARYAAHGSFLTSERPGEIIERLLGAMAGRAAHISDRWWMHAGAYDAPTITLDEDEIVGVVNMEPMPSREEGGNGAKGIFVDPDSFWQATDFPAIRSSAYLAEDGGEPIWADLDYSGFVRSHTQAQRLGKAELLRRRNGLRWSATFRLSAYRAMTARSVNVSIARYGWTPKAFEIVSSGFTLIEGGEDEAPSLGVLLSFRETAAAIWDWSTSEEQAADLTPNTSLPSVTEPPATPGPPYIEREELYETTGSAGVKARAHIIWAASAGPYVREHVLEWKSLRDTVYKRAAAPGIGGVRAALSDLAPGLYLMRTLAVSPWGIESPRSATVLREIVGLTAAPANVFGFAVQSYAEQAKFVWDKATDLDVRIGGRVIIRFSPLLGAGWNEGALVRPGGYPGDTVIGFGPLQTGTYMAKFMDSTENLSASEASFVVTEALLIALTSLGSVSFHPTFAGTKVNLAVFDSKLQLAAAGLWDDIPGNIDDWGLVDYLGGIEESGTVTFSSKLDLGSVRPARLFTTLKSEGFSTGDNWDSRTTLMDDWGSVDGDVIEDAEVEIMVRATDDDPNGSPTWKSWHPLGMVGDYNHRGFEFRADFSSADPTHNRRVSECAVTAKEA